MRNAVAIAVTPVNFEMPSLMFLSKSVISAERISNLGAVSL